ncbi:MAG: GNAT family N-acetyltransferase [Actinomycetota bacterium]|nr:GNAT family N-acetyltransferase [Actinomycetota bacterium]
MSDTDMKGLEIRALDPEDGRAISDAVDVLSVLGEEYMPIEKLLHHVIHHVVMGAFHRNVLIGVVVAHALNSQDFETLERRMGTERLASLSLLREEKTGTVDALAVKESCRRMGKGQGPGIGSRLLAEAVSRLKDSGCHLFFAESWVSGSGDESKNMGARLGGELQLEVPGYWNSDGVYCPVCDSTDCQCTALIFVKTL